mgnify:CR=1 FL=1
MDDNFKRGYQMGQYYRLHSLACLHHKKRITYVIEKRISATESKKNEILWTDWKNDEELKRKKEWEQYLSTLKTEVSPVEETLEIINLKMKIEKLQEEKSSLHKKLNTEIEIEKSVMLFHKLALDKEKITSQKIKEALIEIEETYKVIKKKFY